MGTASALIFNSQLNNTNHCFKCVNTNTNHRTSSLLNISQRSPKLIVSNKRDCYKKFGKVVCFAVEDATEKQQESGRDGVAGVVEDKPGKWNPI